MSQYRQWLSHREIDQQLHAQLATCEQELAQQQEWVDRHADTFACEENSLIQALITMQRATQPPTFVTTPQQTIGITNSAVEHNTDSMSSALLASSQLPNFDAQNMVSNTQQRETPATQEHENLLPSNMSEFVDTHSLTDPQLKIPWWFRNLRNDAEKNPQTTNPIDQQSLRTNQLVQRWFKRWGQEQTDPRSSQKGRHE